jgi:hypothetical protein
MTTLIVKFALAAALALASGAGLIGLSGMIIFADLQTPRAPTVLQAQPLSSSAQTLPFTGQ